MSDTLGFDLREQHLINTSWDVGELLEQLDIFTMGRDIVQFRCPFPSHPGADSRPSARYFRRSNDILCMTEHRLFKALDLLMVLEYDRVRIWTETLQLNPQPESEEVSKGDIQDESASFYLEEAHRLHRQGRSLGTVFPYVERYLLNTYLASGDTPS